MRTVRPILRAMALGIWALPASAAVSPIDTSVCELVRNPPAFSGKMVRVRAQVNSGFEVAVVLAECDHKGVAMSLYYPGLVRDSDRPDFSLQKDENFKQFEEALSKFGFGLQVGLSSKAREGRVFATLVGRFDGPDRLTVTDKTGKTIVRKGYGYTPSTLYQDSTDSQIRQRRDD